MIPDVVTANTWNRLPKDAATARPLPPPGIATRVSNNTGVHVWPWIVRTPTSEMSAGADREHVPGPIGEPDRGRVRRPETRGKLGTAAAAPSSGVGPDQTPPPLALHRFITPPAAIANTCDLLPNIAVTGA